MVITRQPPRRIIVDDVILQMSHAEAQQLVAILDAATVEATSIQSGKQFITHEIASTASTFYHALRKAGVAL